MKRQSALEVWSEDERLIHLRSAGGGTCESPARKCWVGGVIYNSSPGGTIPSVEHLARIVVHTSLFQEQQKLWGNVPCPPYGTRKEMELAYPALLCWAFTCRASGAFSMFHDSFNGQITFETANRIHGAKAMTE